MATTQIKSATGKAHNLLEKLRHTQIKDETLLRKRLQSFKALTEAKRQVASANHNLKIVLDRMANDSSNQAGLLDDGLEKVVGDTMLFLRNAHNVILKLGRECEYDFHYRGPGKEEVKRRRTQNQLEKMILSRKQMARS